MRVWIEGLRWCAMFRQRPTPEANNAPVGKPPLVRGSASFQKAVSELLPSLLYPETGP